jgi:predicted GNAT superfamily acetyltransferase
VTRLPDGITLRDLDGMSEFRAAETLQRAVWGSDDPADPGDLMMVIAQEGGLVAGAFRGADLLGFVFGFPTRDPAVQHSHRLAVLPDARGMGLALALKWYQRDWCLVRGIRLVRWTFDPLRHANASLNIARLGARGVAYTPDYYGPMEGINKGVPSDRLLVEWRLDAPHVARLAKGQTDAPDPSHKVLVAIPPEFGALLLSDPAAALAERLRVRQAMMTRFQTGQGISGYDTGRRAYLTTNAEGWQGTSAGETAGLCCGLPKI